MIKFAGLLETVDSLVDSLDMEEMTGNIPSEKGPERNTAIIKVLDGVAGSAEVAKFWANATQMRRWLTQKKQSLGQKFKDKEDEAKNEEIELKKIQEKILKKAELLVALQ